MLDVMVIGAGIIGSLIAYDLSKYNQYNLKEIEVNSSSGITRIEARQAARLIKRQPGFKNAKSV